MDHRIPLPVQTLLPFDGMPCHVGQIVGCGSNAIVYKGWYADGLHPDLRHHVLIKELFPFHPQGKIRRDSRGGIEIEPEARELWDTHRQSFLAGNEIHLRLLEDHPDILGANLNSFSLNGTLYSVLGYTGGRSLQAELPGAAEDLRRCARRMLGLLDALEAFHKSGYLHLDISPDNIMLVGQGDNERIFLIDYNSARPVGTDEAVYASCKAGYSAPEVQTNSARSIGFSSDLYSVAAVFYRCIMGRPLTLEETLRRTAPDGTGSPCLENVPQTVGSMVGRILKKGLHVLPGKRYQSIGQMRQAFCELIDRIDCVGVTHWSLWENGKRSVEELIRINPSLRYVTEEGTLYPIRLKREHSLSLQEYLEEILSPGGSSGLILAQGGMGKTTLLLHTAMLQKRRYSSAAPAVFYISLNGWHGTDTQYIRSRILMSLRFKREMNTYSSAMHALTQLLQQPLKTRNGEIPAVLLLLDGLNEVRGDISPLVQEINELSDMAGVRILAASRSAVPELALKTAELIPLEREDIEYALGDSGLLVPQNDSVLQLLRTPLILSIYIQASGDGKQLDVQSEEELMNAYLDSLLRKEQRQLPENAPERWQAEAALRFVLPGIAAAETRAGGSLSDGQMLKVVEKCWRVLNSRSMQRAFPQWIGHSRDILGDAKTAEEWYGTVIHRLLWQRLGLLMREPSGGCRIFHQTMKEHLAKADKANRARTNRVCLAYAAAAAALLAVVLTWAFLSRRQWDADVERAVDYCAVSYSACGYQYEQLRELTDYALAGDADAYRANVDNVAARLASGAELTQAEQLYQNYIQENVIPEGDRRVSWSGNPFAGELALELVGYATERAAYYEELLPLLSGWLESDRARAVCPELPELVSRVLEADANLASELYHQTCAIQLEGADAVLQQNVRSLTGGITAQESHRKLDTLEDRAQYLENLRSERDKAEQNLAKAVKKVKLVLSE